jgi:hypothetical protein
MAAFKFKNNPDQIEQKKANKTNHHEYIVYVQCE